MGHFFKHLNKHLLLILLLGFIFQSCSNKTPKRINRIDQSFFYTQEGKKIKLPSEQDSTTTTFIVVRHAEKEQTGKNPDLTPEGMERADRLAEMLKGVEVTHIFSSDYIRTKDTARPTAVQKGLPLDIYDIKNQKSLVTHMSGDPSFKYVLIVGHSDTVPKILNHFSEKVVYDKIPHEEYDNIYFIRKSEGEKTKIFSLKY